MICRSALALRPWRRLLAALAPLAACALPAPKAPPPPLAGTISLASSADMLVGEDAGDAAGWSVAGAGDVNGDGRGDVLVGAWQADDRGCIGAGAAYLVTGPVSGVQSLADATATLRGEADDTYVGAAVGAAGDLDGDGASDLLAGGPGLQEELSTTTWAYAQGVAAVLWGPVSGELVLQDSDALLVGENAYALAGDAVAGVGDTDGDGWGDLLIGAPGDGGVDGSGPGMAHLVAGPVSGTLHLTTDGAASWTGAAARDGLGAAAAAAGDLNGDGLGDLAFGSEGADLSAADAGAAYLVWGPAAGAHVADDADLIWITASAGSAVGSALASAGDTDGDGLAELLVGGRGDATAGSAAGTVWLVGGDAGGVHLLGGAIASLTGTTAHDEAGSAVAGAGDVDQDGTPDVLVGGHRASEGAALAGAAWLVYGPLSGARSLSSADATLLGSCEGDDVGCAVALGDVDGDGAPDLLLGASAVDQSGDAAGAAYLLLGGAG